MYKATVRTRIRRSIRLLNEGRYETSLAVFSQDAVLCFPGDNSWSGESVRLNSAAISSSRISAGTRSSHSCGATSVPGCRCPSRTSW